MRVAFLGNPAWAVPSLRAISGSSHQVVAVLTGLPSKARRGAGTVPSPVAEAARELGLALHETGTVTTGAGLAALTDCAPDALAVVAYGELLPRTVLNLPSVAPVNLHFSLLPRYRGAAPVQNALLDGLSSTGVTTMLMSEGLDECDILLQRSVAIEPDENAGSLGARLAEVGADLMVETLDALASGPVGSVPQDPTSATLAPKITDRKIDWSAPAERIVNLARALGPFPGASTFLRGDPLKVLVCGATDGEGPPGELLRVDPAGPVVAAGQGAVVLLEVAPAGKKLMSGADLCRGLRLRAGERFGA